MAAPAPGDPLQGRKEILAPLAQGQWPPSVPQPAFGGIFALTPREMYLYPVRLGRDLGKGFASGSCWRSSWFPSPDSSVRRDGPCLQVTHSFFHLANMMRVMMMPQCSSPRLSHRGGVMVAYLPPAQPGSWKAAACSWESGSARSPSPQQPVSLLPLESSQGSCFYYLFFGL